MKRKLLHGGTEPVNRAGSIREIYETKFKGVASVAALAKAAVAAGLYDQRVDEAVYRLARFDCRHVLKELDAQGLCYAGPVREGAPEPVWVQRLLWTKQDYVVNDDRLARHEADVHEKRMLYQQEANERFGHIRWHKSPPT